MSPGQHLDIRAAAAGLQQSRDRLHLHHPQLATRGGDIRVPVPPESSDQTNVEKTVGQIQFQLLSERYEGKVPKNQQL